MDPIRDYQNVLQDIETGVVEVWRSHTELTDYAAMRAYEAAIEYYRAVARQQSPKPVTLSGLDGELFAAIKEACERKLTASQSPIPGEDLVACLRKLRKSVDFWTKEGGRQGYFQYINKFLP